MRKRAFGLSWIKESDNEQHQWAHDHLMAKGKISQQGAASTYELLIQIGKELEELGDSGLLLIRGMREAWRQKKHRTLLALMEN